MTHWYTQQEQSAGVKRLVLSWWIYKTFGILPLRVIAFFVISFAYFGLNEQKEALNNYFSTLYNYTGSKRFKPTFVNKMKVFLNYANSLVDKVQAFSGNYKNLKFKNKNECEEIEDFIKNKKGIFFISNHIGNVEIMRCLLSLLSIPNLPRINVFLQQTHCEIFNTFLEKISVETNIETFAIEDIGIETSIKIEERLKNGEFIFMAGDRLSAQNAETYYEKIILGKKVKLPIGVMRFAQMLNSEIYFVTCAKVKNLYKISVKRFEKTSSKNETLEKLQNEYAEYLQSSILEYPYQFYHFFKFFE